MATCYLVPGIGASNLYEGPLMRWLNYTDVVLGRFQALRLADDGVSPGDGGRQLGVDPSAFLGSFKGMLPGYYDTLWQCLEGGLAGYSIVPKSWPYDWRLRNVISGQKLAMEIRQNVPKDDPCCIVGHSMGGLVARLAWYDLRKTNQSGLIRRIVTLGTPHQGAYSGLRELDPSDKRTTTNLLWAANQPIALFPKFPVPKIAVYTYWGLDDIANLALTWPAVYELFPQLGGSEELNDAHRFEIYKTSSFREELTVNAAHLSYVKDTFGPLLLNPSTVPPPDVMMCVAGTGYATADVLVVTFDIFHRGNCNSTDLGDQTVTINSATLSTHYSATLASNHPGLPTASTFGNNIIHWLVDDIPAPQTASKLIPVPDTPVTYSPLPWPPFPVSTGNNYNTIINPALFFDP